MDYKYDVAFSFSGEDRNYVQQVADVLKSNGISVFYDKFEEIDLWGKDLGQHFDYVYRRQSKYFIPFISKSYKEKIWTHYEVKIAIARAIENKEDYILPARFDKTEIDGILSTIAHIDISQLPAEEFAQKIISKIKGENINAVPEKKEPDGIVYLSSYLMFAEYSKQIIGIQIGVTVTNKIKEYRYFNTPYFKISEPLEGSADTFHLLGAKPQLNFPLRMEPGQPYNLMYDLKAGFLDKMAEYRGKNVTLTAFVTTTLDEKFCSNPLDIDQLFIKN